MSLFSKTKMSHFDPKTVGGRHEGAEYDVKGTLQFCRYT